MNINLRQYIRKALLLLFILPAVLFGQGEYNIENLSLPALRDSVELYRNKNMTSFSYFISTLIKKAELQGSKFYESVGKKEKGFYHLIKSELDSAEFCLDNAMLLLGDQEVDSLKWQCIHIKIFQALVAQEKFEYHKTINLWREISEKKLMMDPKADIANSQYMIATIYMSGRRYETAFEYFNKGRPRINSLDHKDVELLGWWHENIGQCYYYTDQLEKAEMHWDSALIIWNHINMVRAKGYLYGHYGDLYMKGILIRACFIILKHLNWLNKWGVKPWLYVLK